MSAETASYIITPCIRTGEVMLTTPCHRGAALARALCKRVARPNGGPWRYYFTPADAQRWLAMMDAGFHAVRRSGGWRYTREPKPVGLARALEIAKP